MSPTLSPQSASVSITTSCMMMRSSVVANPEPAVMPRVAVSTADCAPSIPTVLPIRYAAIDSLSKAKL